MEFVDAHIHLSDEEYSGHVEEVLEEARRADVAAVVSNSVDLKTGLRSLELAEQYPRFVYVALGIHPWNIDTLGANELEQTKELILEQRRNKALIAIGETGLDHKYHTEWEKQLKVFTEMLKLAEELRLPVIIHSRGAAAQIVEMLPSYSLKGVLLHWFSGPVNCLTKAAENGHYITAGPAVVYSTAVREAVKHAPLTGLLTETDGPVRFSKPPFDGKRNTPAFIPTVVEEIAKIKTVDAADAAEQIVQSFESFFGVRLGGR